MLYLQPMKTLLLALLLSFSSLSLANSLKDYYPLDSPENTALFVAIATGDFEKAETLLEAGVNPNKKSVKGATVFTALALNDDEQGSIDFLPTLQKYGADINRQDDDGYAGMVVVIVAGKYKLLYSFLQNGADILTKDNNGFNILHQIARLDSLDFKNPDLIKSLNFILSKVDQEFIDTAGGENKSTALHVAVSNRNVEFIRILDIRDSLNNIPNVFQRTPVILSLILFDNITFELATTPQDINSDKIHEVRALSEISYILLSSLDREDLAIKYDNESVNSVLSGIKQGLTYIKTNQTQVPQLSSLYDASQLIRDFLSQSKAG